MTSTDTRRTAMRIAPAALAQKVAQQLKRHGRNGGSRVLLIRAEPHWDGEPTLRLPDGQDVTVVACVSPLAVWEQVSTYRIGSPLVILSDLTDAELGPGVRSLLFRNKGIQIEPWGLIADWFGAQQVDPRLENEGWAGQALIDAAPAAGWPKLSGTILNRDVALSCLTVSRFTLDIEPDDLDAAALLRWTLQSDAQAALDVLPDQERAGLEKWLADRFQSAARAIVALGRADRVRDALPLGLVCRALWDPANPDATRAKGQVDQYFQDPDMTDREVTAFAVVAEQVTVELMAGASGQDAHLVQHVLARAEDLLIQFRAEDAARYSAVMRSGFDSRIRHVADALQAALAAPGRASEVTAAVDTLADHHLARVQRHRVERARMAARLLGWLASDATVTGVVSAVDCQVTEWGWADLAAGHVWAGDDADPRLQAAYRALYERVRLRRRDLDHAFAQRLATWTPDREALVVESVLSMVVAPLRRQTGPQPLVIVLDGMSAAVAAEVGQELAEHGWAEYDPLPGGDPIRRGVVAALPTLTSVSRTSLLAGALRTGAQAEERAGFERNPAWRGRPARLFHKSEVHGQAGATLGPDLAEALGDPGTLVGVVINTIDDAVHHGRGSADVTWHIADLGPLRALLDQARYDLRPVILISDHGHVWERETQRLNPGGDPPARYRAPGGPLVDGEIEIAGDRVIAEGKRIVALWDEGFRYIDKKAGYHGGASLAEASIPLLAFLPPGGAKVPTGWRPVPDARPAWWSPGAVASPVTLPIPVSSAPARKPGKKPREVVDQAAFDIPIETPAAAPAQVTLSDALFASEVFEAQHALTPRRVPKPKIKAVVDALVDANGVLPLAVLAEKAGEQPSRAAGFVTTLQRIFNVDSFEVLSLTDNDRSVRLNVTLLRKQFGLPQ